jgi:hypothetical protein
MENEEVKQPLQSGGSPLNDGLYIKTKELISAIRSINKSKAHEIKIGWDDEPCYWQRKEWVDWILELANETEKELTMYNVELTRAHADDEK